MRTFIATTAGQNRLHLCELLQTYFDGQWVADHMTPEQAAASVLEAFKRTVAGELELLTLECREPRRDYGRSFSLVGGMLTVNGLSSALLSFKNWHQWRIYHGEKTQTVAKGLA